VLSVAKQATKRSALVPDVVGRDPAPRGPTGEAWRKGGCRERHNGASTKMSMKGSTWNPSLQFSACASISRVLMGCTPVHIICLDGGPHSKDFARRDDALVQPGQSDERDDRAAHNGRDQLVSTMTMALVREPKWRYINHDRGLGWSVR
jgi:hypothetical protein